MEPVVLAHRAREDDLLGGFALDPASLGFGGGEVGGGDLL